MTARGARYRAVLAYDGTDYYGFQRQAGDTPTIQGTVERALARVTGQTITVIGAGRTDTGVHATGQVIAFDADWRHTPDDLLRALNANLPRSIAIQSLESAEASFHPRFDARSRAYVYTLYTSPVRVPGLEPHAWQVPFQPDWNTAAMRRAAEVLVGEHDFATFGTPPQGENTIREVLRIAVEETRDPLTEQPVIQFSIEANAFLYRMVRRIVGALVRVGGGRVSVEAFAQALDAADGSWPNQTAPSHGLCLTKVTY